MIFKNKESEKYLETFGWSINRNVRLPAYIDCQTTPSIVVAAIENLYGLEFLSATGNSRTFKVQEEFIRDFEVDMREWVEDTGISFQFYPLGHMAEHGGILVLDQKGRFYLAGDELIYYGDSLEQFCDVVIFKRRCGLSIRENSTTFYCHNNKNTGYHFDVENGWLGDPEHLDLEYIKANTNS
ncbi:MAG: SUKH-3 domain-containing protein [Ketobacter sp.]|nr:MAG: hypothetical protein D6160_17515 [Ketobacter sp.]